MDYLILEAITDGSTDAVEELEEKVRQFMSLGWVPCGGIAVVREEIVGEKFSGEPTTTLLQAMTHPQAPGPLPE